MTKNNKILLAVVNAVIGLGVYFYSHQVSLSLTEAQSVSLIVETRWLLVVLGLYLLNFPIAYKYRNLFAVSAARMLLFATIAFAAVSRLTDILSEHRNFINTIFVGLTDDESNLFVIEQIRARLAVMVAITVISLTAIALGFESKEEKLN